ncbi:hypothetical protein ACQPW1_14585 [Nocardia sp. CA-128927]|uniref:hypothetical protein n=1 Tax=Nocardia sp. CA-128927 TaxID=3239975 RepID=UPI003D95EDEF
MTDQMPDATQPSPLPITESFAEASPANPHWQLFGGGEFDGKCLQLRTAGTSSNEVPGTAFLDQRFSPSQGLIIDFDYATTTEPDVGEGFGLYLINGDHTTEPGSAEGLGYASSYATPIVPGVTAGWIGIGFGNSSRFTGNPSISLRGAGDLTSGFATLSRSSVSDGFNATWEEGAHIQVLLIDGRLSVRRSSTAKPEGEGLLDIDFSELPDEFAMPETLKLGLAAVGGPCQIRNLEVAAVEQPRITVEQQVIGRWEQTYPDNAKGHVVSYTLTLAAREERVVWWQISFDVPPGTRVNPQQTQWYQVIRDGLEGTVVIASPDDKHTIDPNEPLPVGLQLLYPSQAAAGDGTLRNLHATEVAHP